MSGQAKQEILDRCAAVKSCLFTTPNSCVFNATDDKLLAISTVILHYITLVCVCSSTDDTPEDGAACDGYVTSYGVGGVAVTCLDNVSGGARHLSDDGLVRATPCIQQAALAHIRPPHQHYLPPVPPHSYNS